MRAIKFRALKDDISNCNWVYGNLLYEKDIPRIQENNLLPLYTTCLKGTEGQFTGLLDKNGKEIYKGDIVEWGRTSIRRATVEINPDIQFVDFVHPEWFRYNANVFHYGSFAYKDTHNHLIVIGNVHENPELLKGEY